MRRGRGSGPRRAEPTTAAGGGPHSVPWRTERAFQPWPRGPSRAGAPGEEGGGGPPGGGVPRRLGASRPLPWGAASPAPSWSPPVARRRAGGGEEAVAARAQEGRADCARRVRSGRTAAAGAGGGAGGLGPEGGRGPGAGERAAGPVECRGSRKDETVSGCRGRGVALLLLQAVGTKARAGVSGTLAQQLWGT